MKSSFAAKLRPRSEFFRHVLTLGVGTVLAQSVPILVSPVLTRLYSPEAFGMLALFMSLSAIIGVAADGKYEFAILLPEKDAAAFTIVCLCMLLLVFTTLIFTGLFFGFADKLVRLLRVPHAAVLYLVPGAVFLTGAFRVLSLWFNRRKRYKTLSASRILQTSTTAVFGILFGLMGLYHHGLIWAVLVGYGAVDMLLAVSMIRKDRQGWGWITRTGILEEARRHSNFPKFTIFSSLLEMITMQMPLLLFPLLFGPTVAGWYALSHRVTKTPLNLIVRAVGDVFRQRASRKYVDTGACKNLYAAAFKRLGGISVIPFAGLFVSAPALFSFAFGEEWRMAGHYTRIMVFSYWLQFVSNPLSSILLIAGRQRLNLIIQIINLVGVATAMLVGYRTGSVIVSLYLLMAAGCTKYVMQLISAYHYSSKGPSETMELLQPVRS